MQHFITFFTITALLTAAAHVFSSSFDQSAFQIASYTLSSEGVFVIDSSSALVSSQLGIRNGSQSSSFWYWLGGVANSSLVHSSNGLCLDAQNISSGSLVIQASCNSSISSQKWIMRKDGFPDDQWTIRPATKSMTLCVAVTGETTASVISLTVCESSVSLMATRNQLWYLINSSSTTRNTTSSSSSSSSTTTIAPAPNAPLVFSSGSAHSAPASSCTTICIRREWRELSQSQKVQYANGINIMKSMPSAGGGGKNFYEDFTIIHYINADYAHGTSLFFPWHRRYLVDFENAMRSVLNDNTFCLPYWQWTVDSQAPESSPILQKDSFGTGGNPSTGCVDDGYFKGWKDGYTKKCLKRSGRGKISSWESPSQVNYVIQNSKTYDSFRVGIESGVHAAVHLNIAGKIGDFSHMYSPEDPLFFLHHGMIDKIWRDWQILDKTGKRSSTTYGVSGQSVKNLMPPWNVPVSAYMNADKLCYSYSSGITTTSSSSALTRRDIITDSTIKPTSNGYFSFADLDKYPTLPEDIFNDTMDRSDLYRIRIPDPVPEWYLTSMGQATNVTLVREMEAELAQVVINENKLTRLSSYRSPACLDRVMKQEFVPVVSQQTLSDWLINFSGTSSGDSSSNSHPVPSRAHGLQHYFSISVFTALILLSFVL